MLILRLSIVKLILSKNMNQRSQFIFFHILSLIFIIQTKSWQTPKHLFSNEYIKENMCYGTFASWVTHNSALHILYNPWEPTSLLYQVLHVIHHFTTSIFTTKKFSTHTPNPYTFHTHKNKTKQNKKQEQIPLVTAGLVIVYIVTYTWESEQKQNGWHWT